MEREGRGNAVVGGGAGSGLGPGHLATTLTSFNVSAIANPMSQESPSVHHHNEDVVEPYQLDINTQEKHEIYQQINQLEPNRDEQRDPDDLQNSPQKNGFNTHAASAYGQQTSACFGEVVTTCKNKDRKTHGLVQDEFFTL